MTALSALAAARWPPPASKKIKSIFFRITLFSHGQHGCDEPLIARGVDYSAAAFAVRLIRHREDRLSSRIESASIQLVNVVDVHMNAHWHWLILFVSLSHFEDGIS